MPEDPEKLVVEPEGTDTSQEKVDVTPSPKVSEEESLAAKIKADFEALYAPRMKQLEDGFRSMSRVNTRLQQELEQAKRVSQPTTSPVSPTDPWKGIENGETWKSEIEKLAEQKAEQKLREWQVRQQTEVMAAQQQQALESAKQQVVARYPDLDPDTGDPDTVVSKTYLKLLTEHPDWTTNPYGPLLTMYAMEEALKAGSVNGSEAAKAPNRPTLSSTQLKPSRPGQSPPRLTLTREQKAFCDHHNLKYEDYLKTAAAVEEGVVTP